MAKYPWMLEHGDADVRLRPGEQRDVFNSPLHLSQRAHEVAAGIGVNTLVQLVRAAKKAEVVPDDHPLGRQAIGHVVACYPTLYDKVVDTCNLINWYFVDRGQSAPIAKDDIIVCGFRVRNFVRLPEILGLTLADIAAGAEVPPRLVQSLFSNYRLHLAPVLKIHAFLAETAKTIPHTAEESGDLTILRNGLIHEGVAIDNRPHVNIEKVDDRLNPGSDVYLLKAGDIEKAPPTGHPWAILRD